MEQKMILLVFSVAIFSCLRFPLGLIKCLLISFYLVIKIVHIFSNLSALVLGISVFGVSAHEIFTLHNLATGGVD